MALLWSKISTVLPPNEEQFPLQFSDKVESSVVDMLKRSRQQLYSGDATTSSHMLNAQIILDISWEKLNTGTWRDVDKDWRRVYSYGCLFKVAALCREDPSEDKIVQAIRTCDMGLLMGAAVMDNILHVLVQILQGEVRKPPKEEDESEHTNIKVSGLFLGFLRFKSNFLKHFYCQATKIVTVDFHCWFHLSDSQVQVKVTSKLCSDNIKERHFFL